MNTKSGRWNVIVVCLLALAASAYASFFTVTDPHAPAVPADPNAPLCVEVPVNPLDAPPPFGTVVRQWNLGMSGSYAGAGIVWRRDQGRFYLMDQGYSGPPGVWSFDPNNPTGTMRNENWVFPNFGTSTRDVPWGIAWDPDSNCFWITQVIDAAGGSNVYYGCALLRMTPQGTWTGDSWRIGIGPSGNPGGPFTCYWMAGFEKWPGRGIYYGTPVSQSPSDFNRVVMFDPYKKQYLGRVAYGDQTSERGCALVPYDSLYILTCGWNANTWRKRREDGYQLQSVSATVYGPADWAMWVPQTVQPTDTVYVFCINSNSTNTLQKISCGFTWGQLPSVAYKNVAPTAILAPAGAVDSGSIVIPVATVTNKGPKTVDSFDVYMRIGTNYQDRKIVRNLSGGSSASVSFSAWVPTERDSVTATVFTWWPEDQVRKDDTMRSRFLSRVKDVAVTEIIWPKDTLDSAEVVYPQCRVKNKGTAPQTFDVRFRFGSYDERVTVANVPPGVDTQITAVKQWVAQSGSWLHRVEAELAGDVRPDDNVMLDTFWVLGTPGVDVAAERVLSPVGRMKPEVRVNPSIRVGNYSGQRLTFLACLTIWDKDNKVVFHDSRNVNLAGGAFTNVAFAETCFRALGSYVTRCSVYLEGDQNVVNDVVRDKFEVDTMAYGHNVGVQAILVPTGTVDSGTVVVPQAVVVNTGLATETFTAYFALPGYTGVANIVGLPPESSRTVQFTPWQVRTPRGSKSATVWTLLPSDQYSRDDTMIGSFEVGVTDVGVVSIVGPRGTLPADTSLYPECVVRNYGTAGASFDLEFRIGTWADTVRVENLAAQASRNVTAGKAYTTKPGVWLSVASTLLAGDRMPDNNTWADTFQVPGVPEHDVGVQEILAPAGGLDTITRIAPLARIANYGRNSETWWTYFKVYDPLRGVIYNESLRITLPGQTSLVFEFPDTVFRQPGNFTSRCSTFLATDQNWTNNTAVRQFQVGGSASWPKGWKEVRSVPPRTSGKPVGDGGCLAIDRYGTIYAVKGYKTCDFQAYSPLNNVWTPLESIVPNEGTQIKPPGKGACLVSDGDNYLYLVKGNNTLGFWRYNIAQKKWERRKDIPLGSGKKVKGGSDAVYVYKNDTGYVYLLKGYLNEFYRYNTIADRWDQLTPAPYGGRQRYERGSWLCVVPRSELVPVWRLYLHQAKYYNNDRHYMFVYDLDNDVWLNQPVKGMPLLGMHGGAMKIKKSKDGGAATESGGYIYALKGGGTQQFFRYSPRNDAWEELDTVPRNGSAGKKWVKGGADIVSYEPGKLFALKGGKTAEMWRYVDWDVCASNPAPSNGVQAGRSVPNGLQVTVGSNPTARGLVTVQIAGMSNAEPGLSSKAIARVFDASGRCVFSQEISPEQLPVALDLRSIPAGVYLLRVEASGCSQARRLVLVE